MELLQQRGASVDYHGPHVRRPGKMRRYEFGLESVPLTAETLRQDDCVLISTDHTACDYDLVVKESSLVADTRNATSRITHSREK